MITVEVNPTNSPKFAIIVCYKPPNVDNSIFVDNLRAVLNGILGRGIMDIHIFGDLNIPEIDWATGYPTAMRGIAFAPSVVLVVNPLSLIQHDQVRTLTSHGIAACRIEASGKVMEGDFGMVMKGKYDIINCHPEAPFCTGESSRLLSDHQFSNFIKAMVRFILYLKDCP